MAYKHDLARWRARRIKIHRLHKSGMSYAEIGRKLGISRQRVRQFFVPDVPHNKK